MKRRNLMYDWNWAERVEEREILGHGAYANFILVCCTKFVNMIRTNLKCLWHEIFFLREYLAYHMYKPIPIE